MKLKSYIWAVAILFLLGLTTSFVLIEKNKISLQMESKFVYNGKAVSSQANVYYNYDQGKMVTYFTKPAEYYLITNAKGEAKIYYPEQNEVMLHSDISFNTEKSLLYYFLSNKIYDLGLKDLGFTLFNTRFEEGLMITEWKPIGNMNKNISKIEMVHKDYLPIYLAYYNAKGQLAQKIYYYKYTKVSGINFPQKVVEMTYLTNGDSTINRTVYSNIAFGMNENNKKHFQFKVPANATIIEKEPIDK